MVHTCTCSASAGYTRCFCRTSVYLCASLLQNHAVTQEFYSHFSVTVKRSCRPCIWWCGTGEFQEQGRCFSIGLSCSLPFTSITFFNYSFQLLTSLQLLFSAGWYCGAVVFGLIGRQSLPPSVAFSSLFKNNDNNIMWHPYERLSNWKAKKTFEVFCCTHEKQLITSSKDRYTFGVLSAYSWCTLGLLLVYSWPSLGVLLVYSRLVLVVPLVYSWLTPGLLFVYV